MGNRFWIEARGRPQAETANNSPVSHTLVDLLDTLAGKLGVEPFSGFFDYSDLNLAYSDEIGVALPDDPTDGTWFDSAAGPKVIGAPQDRFATHPADLRFRSHPGQDGWPARLNEELQPFRSVLERAVADGQPFRLLVVPSRSS